MAIFAQNSTASIAKPHFERAGFAVPPHPTKPPCKPGQKCDPGGGGYNCATDGAAILGVGTALLVIGVLAAPEVGILALGFWGPMSFWGGVGVGAWTGGHAVHCGF